MGWIAGKSGMIIIMIILIAIPYLLLLL
uniref:Putative disease resistance protein RGA3 n=1 Tax=Rhizophora mucronata TaxID=61149 RepID=A0A2P2L9I9_RHIMU